MLATTHLFPVGFDPLRAAQLSTDTPAARTATSTPFPTGPDQKRDTTLSTETPYTTTASSTLFPPSIDHMRDTTRNTEYPPNVVQTTPHSPPPQENEIELPEDLLKDMLAESSPQQHEQPEQTDDDPANATDKKTVYPVWIHKADYRPISQKESDSLKCDMMKNFLSLARNGELTIDFRFTSKFSDLQSGKLKLTSESPEAAEAIKRILTILPFWRVLSAEDLNTQEGKTFWMFCPPVCHEFVTDNSLNELIRAHTGWFLEDNDVRTALPPKIIKDTRNHLCYIFLSYKAQRYFMYFKWKISLLGCTLKLQEYGEMRDTTPTLTKDNSPQDLVQSLSTSTLQS